MCVCVCVCVCEREGGREREREGGGGGREYTSVRMSCSSCLLIQSGTVDFRWVVRSAATSPHDVVVVPPVPAGHRWDAKNVLSNRSTLTLQPSVFSCSYTIRSLQSTVEADLCLCRFLGSSRERQHLFLQLGWTPVVAKLSIHASCARGRWEWGKLLLLLLLLLLGLVWFGLVCLSWPFCLRCVFAFSVFQNTN